QTTCGRFTAPQLAQSDRGGAARRQLAARRLRVLPRGVLRFGTAIECLSVSSGRARTAPPIVDRAEVVRVRGRRRGCTRPARSSRTWAPAAARGGRRRAPAAPSRSLGP